MAWETEQDKQRERAIAAAVRELWPTITLHETPRFHPTDAHAMGKHGYAGDFEYKWYNQPSTEGFVFNYNKWQNLYLLDSVLHRPQTHRIAIRFDDGLLVMPVTALANKTPTLFTRRDTGEIDLVLKCSVGELPANYWFDKVITL